MPGYRISSTTKDTIDKRYLCPLCDTLFRDPVQTECGHVYCNSCVQELKRHGGGFICPVDKISFHKVFLDNFMKREVLSQNFECPNSKDGCTWKGEVRHSEQHLASCPAEKEHCTNYNCPESIKRSDFQRHVEHECPYRQQLCPLCGESITAAVLKSHQAQDCKMFPVQCRGCGKEGIPRGEMENHVNPNNGDCEAVEKGCRFEQIGCEVKQKMKQSEASKHNQLCSVLHLNLLLSFVLRLEKQVRTQLTPLTGAYGGGISDEWIRNSETFISNAISRIDTVMNETTDLRQKLHDHARRLNLLEGTLTSRNGPLMASMHSSLQSLPLPGDVPRRLTNAENANNNMEFLIGETGRELENVKLEVSSLRRQVDGAVESIRRLERRLDAAEHNLALRNVVLSDMGETVREQQISSYDGILLWKVTDFALKRNDALSGRQTSIYSPCFYTSHYGYKMCARLYLNGDGMGRGTHLSVFFVVMRGEYDALLRWPFRQKVTIMLLDQDNVEHVIDAFRPDPSSSSFQRPRRESNIASGCPMFCSLSVLNTHSYVREDTVFFRIIVDTTDI